MPPSRQLAAIMFTDIVGYTALMGEDEQKAFEILNENRKLQKPLIEQYGGRCIKELGDGVLACFTTVSDAVNAAIKIQEACNATKEFLLRIGIHHGEVVFDEDDIFGDAVNIASRIQSLAPIGGIWISESVHNNVSNKKDIATKFVRAENLKNVKEPVRLYEVFTSNTKEEENKSPVVEKSTGKTQAKSIAVLPFVDMSSSQDQEYLGDGLAEEILNSIVHLKDLKVAGRTSSFQFKGKNIDLREVGQKLGVNSVLEGSVRKQGNRLRITAQLINVEDGFHFWSERYDRNMDDIFAIQDEIAFAITEQLKVTLFEKDIEKIITPSTQNAEAYEMYLKGMFYLSRRGSFIITALDFFKQAIHIDPTYALAYAGYAEASIYSAFYSFISGKKVMQEVKQAAETAIRLNNSLCEPYISLGHYYLNFEWNWAKAKKNYTKAVELNPRHAQAHSLYGMLYLAWVEGKFDEAERQGQIAIKLEPLSAVDYADLAWTLCTACRFEEALALARIGIELDANSFLSHRLAGFSYLGLQRYDEAIEIFKYLMKTSNRHQHALNPLIWACCKAGNLEEARLLMNELEARVATEYIAGTYLGLSAAYLGQMDLAFNYLEKAFIDLDPILIQLNNSPFVPALLKNDRRFQNLLTRIGFPG
jgi:TolB-like protein/class 3 adenylate cyclase/Tfp pilus assembly protein PilF